MRHALARTLVVTAAFADLLQGQAADTVECFQDTEAFFDGMNKQSASHGFAAGIR
ncbi:hypothetical protein [Methylobacterium indicum]|uniref:hypothetical protein n=1 Tax=Methylobacterium indicum TaxID=1775910 RepID=UPI0024348ACC|nr:hypothetical protein [Methylobacterium indicum]